MHSEAKRILREVQSRLRKREVAPDYENVRVRSPPISGGGGAARAASVYPNVQAENILAIYDVPTVSRSPVIRRGSSPMETSAAGERAAGRQGWGRQDDWWSGHGRAGERRTSGDAHHADARRHGAQQMSPFCLHIPRVRVEVSARRKSRSMLLTPGSQEDAGVLEIYRDPRARSTGSPLPRPSERTLSPVGAGQRGLSRYSARYPERGRPVTQRPLEPTRRLRQQDYDYCPSLLPRIYLNMR